MLNAIGYNCIIRNFRIVNVIGNCDLERQLDLNKCARLFGTSFEPELFPGLPVKLQHCTAVLFRTGKCNFLGCKQTCDVYLSYLELLAKII